MTTKLFLNFSSSKLDYSGEYQGRKFDSLQVKHFTPKTIQFVAIKDGMKMFSFGKRTIFENGRFYVKFGDIKIDLGEYKETA